MTPAGRELIGIDPESRAEVGGFAEHLVNRRTIGASRRSS